MAYQPKINQAKTEAVEDIKGILGNAEDFFFTNYRGLSVAQITTLRHRLRELGADYHVVKNNYANLAFQQLGKKDVSDLLAGPTAVAVARRDSGAVAKALVELIKELGDKLEVKGGLVGESVFDANQVNAYSKLPSRLELYAILLGTMKAPVQNLAIALNGVASKLVRTLQAVADQKASE